MAAKLSVVIISSSLSRAYEFACHSASCRPPASGGTGGSKSGGYNGPKDVKLLGMSNAALKKAGTPAHMKELESRRKLGVMVSNTKHDSPGVVAAKAKQAAALKRLVNSPVNPAKLAAGNKALGIAPKKKSSWSDYQGN